MVNLVTRFGINTKGVAENMTEGNVKMGLGFHYNKVNDGYGLFDSKGRMLFPFAFDAIQKFNDDGYAWVCHHHKWGLLNKGAMFQIICQYEDVGSFVDRVCWVKRNGLWGRIDYNCNEVTPFAYQGNHAEGGILVVGKEGAYGAIDGNGNHVLPEIYDRIGEVSLKIASPCCCYDVDAGEIYILCAIKDEHYLLIDKYGHPYFDIPFDQIYGEQACHGGDGWGIHKLFFESYNDRIHVSYIDENQKRKVGVFNLKEMRMIVPCIYEKVHFRPPSCEEYDYLIAWREGKCVLLDKDGKEMTRPEYDFIGYAPFAEGEYLIPTYNDGKWGYINVYGTVKIPFCFASAGPFVNGKAVVSYITYEDNIRVDNVKTNKFLYIDRHGNVIGEVNMKDNLYGLFEPRYGDFRVE